jgi:hypothetical protein
VISWYFGCDLFRRTHHFDDFTSQRHPLPIEFADHGPVAWVPEFGIDVVTHEIKKGRELGIADSLGVGFVSFGETVQVG